MLDNPTRFSSNKTINLIINLDGLGDAVTTLPVLRYMFKNFSSPMQIWSNSRMAPLLELVVPKGNLFITNNDYKEVNRANSTRTASIIEDRMTTSGGDLVQHYAWSLMNRSLPVEESYYPKYDTSNIDISEFEKEVDLSKVVYIIPTTLWMSKAF